MTLSKILLVEGKDELSFFNKLLQDLDISDVEVFSVGGKTKEKFIQELQTTKNNKSSNFRHASHIAIVRDADSFSQNEQIQSITPKMAAFQSIQDICNKVLFPSIKDSDKNSKPLEFNVNSWIQKEDQKVGIFIITNENNEEGMLENLCLELVKKKPEMLCVNNFIDCIKKTNKLQSESKNKAKNYLVAQRIIYSDIEIQAYLSASSKKPANSVGVAAEKNYWWTQESLQNNKNLSQNFIELKQFLEEFAK